jgi:uncharacterized lipoprotein YehR (DUF1307 family)
MKYKLKVTLLFVICLLMMVVGCESSKLKEKVEEKTNEQTSLSTNMDSLRLKGILKADTKTYVDSVTGDTLYVNFTYKTISRKEYKLRKIDYYIVGPKPVYEMSDSFREDLKKWEEKEELASFEEVHIGNGRQFFIAISQVRTQSEAIKELKRLRAKYPKQKLNFYHIKRSGK